MLQKERNYGLVLMGLFLLILSYSLSYGQCDANDDNVMDILDVIIQVNCVLEGCLEFGCMDETACNYNPIATTDDGSCYYEMTVVCYDDADGDGYYNNSQYYEECDAVCSDLGETWSDSQGNGPEVYGCTDLSAMNYNPDATEEDGSCEYPIVDYDGNFYLTVVIGDQEWLAENLKVTHYRNGDEIPNITDGAEWWETETGAYGNYDDDESNVEIYGRMYNWFAVIDERELSPEGWHIATDDEWTILVDFVSNNGYEYIEGNALKEVCCEHWNEAPPNPDGAGLDIYGFTTLPGGYRYSETGTYHNMGNNAYFWTSTEYDPEEPDDAWYRKMDYNFGGVRRYDYPKKTGFSVRCIKDN